MTLVLVLHAVATFAMTGLIWFVQVVHYPLMAGAEGPGFARHAAEHQRLTGYVVGPPMILEIATGALLVAAPPDGVPRWLPIVGAALLAVVWTSTAALQMPRHRELARGFDALSHRRLVRDNRLRTAAWTARTAVVATMLVGALG